MRIVADFETANTDGVDLKEVGAERYSLDPATEVLCLCLLDAETREPLLTWKPNESVARLRQLAEDQTVHWEAHNAGFEQMIWQNKMEPLYGLPPLPYTRWSCSMAKAFAKGYPGALAKLAMAIGAAEQKDMEGSALTISLSKPMTKVAWEEMRPADWTGTKKAWMETFEPRFDRRPETIEKVVDYCIQDDKTEAEVSAFCGELSSYERQVWEHDQAINQRGVKVDLPFVYSAIKVVEDAKTDIIRRFGELTGGLGPNQVARVKEWCAAEGVVLEDLTAPRIDKLLGGALEADDVEDNVVQRGGALPTHVHEVLSLRRLLGAKAVEKLPRIAQWVGAGSRCRYLLQYHAAGTGRWAGRGWQPQNLPRASVPDPANPDKNLDPDKVVEAFMTRDFRQVQELLQMDPIIAAGRAIRHAMIPEQGRRFCSADFAGIEMRIDLALAGQDNLIAVLAAGDSPYIPMAEAIFGRPIDKKRDIQEYTLGKSTILGCGFQMGAQTFFDRYCSHLSLEFAQKVVNTYRKETAPKVPQLWYAIEDAAGRAMETGQPSGCDAVTYIPSQVGDWLEAHLPDGQVMWYAQPRYDGEDYRGKPKWSFMSWKDGQWKRVSAYGGLLTENVVQKLARGLLCCAMRRLEAHGFPVVLTVHDDILAEPLIADADQVAFEQIMSDIDTPETRWAQHFKLPVAVEGWTGTRGRK